MLLFSDCDACFSEICNGASECVSIDGSVTCDNDSSCLMENSIVDCQSSDSRRLLSLVSTSPAASEDCLEYEARSMSTSGTGTIPTGLYYIIESFRFCTNQSIGRILLRTNSPGSATNVENLIEFHVYKQYRAQGGGGTEFFVRSTSFNVTLSYSEALSVLVAVPVTPIRVDQGDYLGLTIRENIGILTTGTAITAGVYTVTSPIGQCSGSTLDVFEINPDVISNNIVPLISVEEEEEEPSKCSAR